MTLSEVVTLLLAPVREVVKARPVTGPLTLAPIVGLRFGFLLDGRFRRERVEGFALLVFAGELVGLRLRVELIVGVVHIFRILGVESLGKKYTNQEGDGKASAQDEGKHFDDGCEFFHTFNLSEVE